MPKKNVIFFGNARVGVGYVLNLERGFVRMGKAVLPEP
jgi:hypothetical protein